MTFCYHLDEINILAKTLLRQLPCKLWAFDAPMGSGKTTLIRALCAQLGISEVSSPTFSIVNQYEGLYRVFHFDLYRLKDLSELRAIGFEEYLEQGGYTFIEWAGLAKPLLPEEGVHHIRIEVKGNDRILEIV